MLAIYYSGINVPLSIAGLAAGHYLSSRRASRRYASQGVTHASHGFRNLQESCAQRMKRDRLLRH
jgi:hypothetical protein